MGGARDGSMAACMVAWRRGARDWERRAFEPFVLSSESITSPGGWFVGDWPLGLDALAIAILRTASTP